MSNVLAEIFPDYANSGLTCPTKAGSSLPCPKCKTDKLWIPKSLAIAKCMRPNCGYRKVAYKPRQFGWVDTLIEEIYKVAHPDLITPHPTSEAMEYLLSDRHLHRDVIEAAPLGSVPVKIDWAAITNTVAAQIEKDDQAFHMIDVAAQLKGRRRERDPPTYKKENHEKQAEEDITNARKLFTTIPGWLMFFYESGGNWTSINLRRPSESKEFKNFRPGYVQKGCFSMRRDSVILTPGRPGNRSPKIPPHLDLLDGEILGVEGEVNLLQMYSLLARYANEQGAWFTQICKFDGIAFGGSSDPDFAAAESYRNYLSGEDEDGTTQRPELWLCYDDDAPGEAMVDKMALKMFGAAWCVPEDLDAFILWSPTPGGHYQKMAAIGECLAEAVQVFRTPNYLKELIADTLGQKNPQHTKEEYIVKFVMDDITERCLSFKSGPYQYLFFRETRKLAIWDEDPDIYKYLDQVNLFAAQKLTQLVIKQIRVRLADISKEVKVHQFSHTKRETNTTYVNLGNNKMLVVSSTGTKVVDNGTDDVYFLLADLEPFDPQKLVTAIQSIYNKTMDTTYTDKFLVATYSPSPMNVDDPKSLVHLWMMDFLFGDRHAFRPMLIFQGCAGSGKSLLAEKILRFTLGKEYKPEHLAEDDKDFRAQITCSPLTVLDNVDEAKATTKKLDILATCADRGHVAVRELYVTNKQVKYPLTPHLIVTTMAAKFLRNDIADRSIIINFDRRGTGDADKETKAQILDEVTTNREILLAHFTEQLRLVYILQAQHADDIPATELRLREFYQMAVAYAWGKGPEAAAKMVKMLNNLYVAQMDAASNEDPLHLAIQLLIGDQRRIESYSASTLMVALCKVIDDYTPNQSEVTKWNARQLAQKIGSQKNILTKKYGLRIDQSPHGHTNTYIFQPTPEVKRSCQQFAGELKGTISLMVSQGLTELDDEATG